MDAIRRPKACCSPNCTSYRLLDEPKIIHFVRIQNTDKDDTYTRYEIVEEPLVEIYVDPKI